MTSSSFSILTVICFAAGVASADVLDPYAVKENGAYNAYGTKYPVTGCRGLPWFVHWDEIKENASVLSNRYKKLTTWADDNGVNLKGSGEQNTGYSFTTVVGPNAPLKTQNMFAGTFSFEPGVVYGVGQHAAWEIYLVVSGEAKFYNYDKEVHAKQGTWIMMRPFDPHGIKNASATEPLEIAWFWWKEDPNRPNWATGGLPFQPQELWIGNGLKPDLIPSKLPPEPTGEDRFKLMYADENEVD